MGVLLGIAVGVCIYYVLKLTGVHKTKEVLILTGIVGFFGMMTIMGLGLSLVDNAVLNSQPTIVEATRLHSLTIVLSDEEIKKAIKYTSSNIPFNYVLYQYGDKDSAEWFTFPIPYEYQPVRVWKVVADRGY